MRAVLDVEMMAEAYPILTHTALHDGVSNCPACAREGSRRIWTPKEMILVYDGDEFDIMCKRHYFNPQ